MNDLASQVMQLAERIKPLLAGNPPEVQSAALGELLSVFLAGHFVINPETGVVDEDATSEVRGGVLQEITRLAFQLLPLNHSIIMERHLQP